MRKVYLYILIVILCQSFKADQRTKRSEGNLLFIYPTATLHCNSFMFKYSSDFNQYINIENTLLKQKIETNGIKSAYIYVDFSTKLFVESYSKTGNMNYLKQDILLLDHLYLLNKIDFLIKDKLDLKIICDPENISERNLAKFLLTTYFVPIDSFQSNDRMTSASAFGIAMNRISKLRTTNAEFDKRIKEIISTLLKMKENNRKEHKLKRIEKWLGEEAFYLYLEGTRVAENSINLKDGITIILKQKNKKCNDCKLFYIDKFYKALNEGKESIILIDDTFYENKFNVNNLRNQILKSKEININAFRFINTPFKFCYEGTSYIKDISSIKDSIILDSFETIYNYQNYIKIKH